MAWHHGNTTGQCARGSVERFMQFLGMESRKAKDYWYRGSWTFGFISKGISYAPIDVPTKEIVV